ncbi:type II secretory pathway, ATPase PulE/Tfp pilus assembly pathway, ATPase PilB [Oscillatoria acuminata]|uniref:Type II secretory pathway, ATPase PulE/Tfp pilus assembly pathway, ATPase PilB n=1 Tax=Oscillatoria acuminata PCC 6304 TaxID=56110 RepID=K9TQD0_9CYAN|nr:type II secretory pathway, ATPase PulE/Tfp pilus assembly pathway, ATPase PilB [Oscillatoria acuminata]AFY85062.1 type II secretory pathway, ATPase PulE/Tfp pilus assembly pathway, ATPase PilB [Oscillatoria acuminata PCC 6304]
MQTKTVTHWAAQMDSEQIFQLIDNLLPFEACLYHEVLPLSIKGSRLHLGMVDPEDSAALEYVRRILGYMRCSLVSEKISTEIHRSMLSAYLNYMHTGKKKASAAPHTPGSHVPAPPLPPLPNSSHASSVAVHSRNDLLPPPHSPSANGDRLSLPAPHSASMLPGPAVPVLQVSASHPHSPLEELATLPPKDLLQELLGRILEGGIGRLYFERQSQHGRILWSQDGVVQSVMDGLELSLFGGVMNELKLLAHLPLIPLQKPRQVEIERRYNKEDLLLRLRVMPGTDGERATLQVLRGAALKFYKQQQVEDLSRDALRLALQLQRKVDELRDRASKLPDRGLGKLDALPALNQLIRQVDEQLAQLKALDEHKE